MSTLINLKQNTPEWLEFRRKKLGASDAAVIMGISPWKTRFQLWEEKSGLREDTRDNDAMKRGRDLEEEARHAFEQETGIIISPQIMVHPEYDFLMASFDGIDSSGKHVVEIKCPGPIDHNIALQGDIPKKYMPQLQHQMEVAGVDSMYYFSYSRKDTKVVEVKRDDNYILNLLNEEKSFWESVLNGIAPDLSERDYQERHDDQWHHAVHQWKYIKNQLETCKVQEEEARHQLITLSGGSSVKGGGIKLSKMIRKGSINYQEIPELSVVNLEQYRKAPVESWRILEY